MIDRATIPEIVVAVMPLTSCVLMLVVVYVFARIRRLIMTKSVKEDKLEQLLLEAIEYQQDQFDGDGDLQVSGCDLVEWFCDWRTRVKKAMAVSPKLMADEPVTVQQWVAICDDPKLKELEAKLTLAAQKKYPGCVATYMTSTAGYSAERGPHWCGQPSDTPASIFILFPDGAKTYDHSTDFAEIVQEYRAELGFRLGITMPKDHWLVTGQWPPFEEEDQT